MESHSSLRRIQVTARCCGRRRARVCLLCAAARGHCGCCCAHLFVRCHSGVVEGCDIEHADWEAAFVAAAGPVRILCVLLKGTDR